MKTKSRGLRRKSQNMVRRLSQQTEVFPKAHQGVGFWHLHLPVSHEFIDSSKAPFGIRRLCAQTLINRAFDLAALAPDPVQTRVVAAISLPELWSSQIVVFFGPDYFNSFFDRDSTEQKWTPIEGRRLTKKWHLQLPHGLSERGTTEEIFKPDFASTGELWFIGQLAPL